MRSWKFAVLFVTAALIIQHVALFFDNLLWLVIGLFCLSPFLVIWMAVRILKADYHSTRTFNEGYYYEDIDKQYSRQD